MAQPYPIPVQHLFEITADFIRYIVKYYSSITGYRNKPEYDYDKKYWKSNDGECLPCFLTTKGFDSSIWQVKEFMGKPDEECIAYRKIARK